MPRLVSWRPEEAARLAALINHYHRLVRAAPPRRNTRLGFVRYFFLARHACDGERLTLWQLEARIRRFGDPRVHFALNCGAVSCPPIRTYEAAQLDVQLELATRAYLSSPAALRIDVANGSVALSRIFRWYRREFGEPLAFVAAHCDAPTRAALEALGPHPNITYLAWDWTPAKV